MLLINILEREKILRFMPRNSKKTKGNKCQGRGIYMLQEFL